MPFLFVSMFVAPEVHNHLRVGPVSCHDMSDTSADLCAGSGIFFWLGCSYVFFCVDFFLIFFFFLV